MTQVIVEVGETTEETPIGENGPEFRMLGVTKLNAPWLGDNDEQIVYRYADGRGGTIVGVNAMSPMSEKIEQASVANNATEAGLFNRVWMNLLNKVAAERNPGSLRFRALTTSHTSKREEYDDITIQYDGLNRPNAPRVYFTLLPARQLVGANDLERMRISEEEPMIAILGRCNKAKQVQMLQQFTTATTASLRSRNVGS